MLKRRTASAGFFPQIWDNKTNDSVILEGQLSFTDVKKELQPIQNVLPKVLNKINP